MNVKNSLRVMVWLIGVGSAAVVGAQPSAAGFPVRPIRLIVPNAAGGTTDLVARTVGQKLAEALGQQVVVDNRPGSGGIIGTEAAAKSAPDGYTLLMGTIGNIAISPHLYRKLAYDSVRDFAPITQLAAAAYMVVTHPSLPVSSVGELVALAKAKPGHINYGSAGSGTGSHLSAELFKSISKIDIAHIPYKGGTPALTDVIAGHVQVMFNGIPSSVPHLKSGRIKALAVTTSKRSPAAPGIPTIAEAGFPGAESTSWTGVLAPAGTPAAIVSQLHAELVKVLHSPDVKARLAADGAVAVDSSPAEFGAYIRSELAKWGNVVKTSGATVN